MISDPKENVYIEKDLKDRWLRSPKKGLNTVTQLYSDRY